jgi:glycosyltransferase involved in cell wall biosynthesis
MIIVIYEVIRRNLLPCMAQKSTRILWLVPKERYSSYCEWTNLIPNIEIYTLGFSYRHPFRLLNAVLRRIENALYPVKISALEEFQKWIQLRYVNDLAKKNSADWIFCLAFMNQPIPLDSIPIAGILHDLSSDLSMSTLRNIHHWLDASSIVFCVSRFTSVQLENLRGDKPIKRIKTVPICPSKHSFIHTHHLYGLKSNQSRATCKPAKFFFPASFTPRKGHSTFFKAVKIALKNKVNLEIVLVGSGTDRLEASEPPFEHLLNDAYCLYQGLKKEGCNIRALGHIDDDLYSEELFLSDVVIFPTLYEGYGLPVSEAVMNGIPVIASDLPPIREQLDLFQCHDRVLLVSANDVQAWASVIENYSRGKIPPRLSPDQLRNNFQSWTWDDVAFSILLGLHDA